MTLESVLLWIAGVQMPRGEPEKARQAAVAWRELANRIESGREGMEKVVAEILANNAGAGVDAFRDFWNSSLAPTSKQVGDYCRSIAMVCERLAEVLEQARRDLQVIAFDIWINILYTIAYQWITSWIFLAVKAKLEAERRLLVIKALATRARLRKAIATLMNSLTFYVADSFVYPTGQLALHVAAVPLGNAMFDGKVGVELGKNAEQWGAHFLANAGFDAAWDVTKLYGAGGRLGRLAFPASRTGNFFSRMVASETYTMTFNLFDPYNEDGGILPTLEQQPGKLFTHLMRMLKPV